MYSFARSFVTGFVIALSVLLCFFLVPAISRAEGIQVIEVWWPTNNVTVSGLQPIKGMLTNVDIKEYKLYWTLDNNNLNELHNNYTDYPHKETDIDFSSWNWNGEGTYTISLIAKDMSGNEKARTSVSVKVVQPASGTSQVTSSVTPVVESKLYVPVSSSALKQAADWKVSRPDDARIMEKLAAQSVATWLVGGSADDVKSKVAKVMEEAKNQNAIPTFVLYNIPNRDASGGYSSGGMSNKEAYTEWVRAVSSGIGSADAMVIVEPDALAGNDALSDTAKTERYEMISSAVSILDGNSKTKIYIDAGHANWIGADEMSKRLSKANISKADGFSLNVSNFVATNDSVAYGKSLSEKVNNKHFVVDTSRNGSGSNGEWCNPSGRSLGKTPTRSTSESLVDAYLWVKVPGESDGNCNGGPGAGQWWPEYVLDLAKMAGW